MCQGIRLVGERDDRHISVPKSIARMSRLVNGSGKPNTSKTTKGTISFTENPKSYTTTNKQNKEDVAAGSTPMRKGRGEVPQRPEDPTQHHEVPLHDAKVYLLVGEGMTGNKTVPKTIARMSRVVNGSGKSKTAKTM